MRCHLAWQLLLTLFCAEVSCTPHSPQGALRTQEDDQPAACGQPCHRPDVPDGCSDSPRLFGGARTVAGPDGMWPESSHLWLPCRKHFRPQPSEGGRAVFSFPLFLWVQAAFKKTVKANITVLSILCDSIPPWTQRPSLHRGRFGLSLALLATAEPGGGVSSEPAPHPTHHRNHLPTPCCLASPFYVLFP